MVDDYIKRLVEKFLIEMEVRLMLENNAGKISRQKKTMKTARLDILVTPQLKQKLIEHATAQGISVAQYIVQLIRKDLNLDPKEYR